MANTDHLPLGAYGDREVLWPPALDRAGRRPLAPLFTVPPLPSFHFLDFNHIKQVPEGPLDCALGVGVG